MRIEAKGTVTLDDHIRLNRLAFTSLCRWLVPVGFVTWLLFYKLSHGFIDSAFWVQILLACVFLVFFWFRTIPSICRALYKRKKSMEVEWSYEMNDETFNSSSSIGTSHLAWTDYYRWKSGKDFIQLHLTEAMVEVLPKRFFKEGDFEILVEFLKTKLPKK